MSARLYAVISILLVSLLLGGAILWAQTPVGSKSRLAWDQVSTLEDGVTPCLIAEFELAAFDEAGTTLLGSIKIPACDVAPEMTCEEAFVALGLPQGTYALKVRAITDQGEESGWSNTLTVKYMKPKAPVNLRKK